MLDSAGYTKRNVHNVSEIWGFVAILAVLLLSYLTRHNLRDNLPNALGNANLLRKPNTFIEERAWKDLRMLTSFGPRPAGTFSNEILAVDFLKREINYIKETAHKSHHIDVDVQVVSGAYLTSFRPFSSTSVYRNVQNVVVRLLGEPQSQNNSTLLLNCHFDTVASSPGASDDAASCAVMLEVLRVLSRSTLRNKHSIIFLFNGAEETGLQASHGFITQHKWASEIKNFINLESVGSGGKELLFQSTPNNSWLLSLYGKSAPYPSAQAAAEEVFQSGLIPSYTDFRIFNEYGGIPGLDFAHVINGYRYHTKYDSINYIPRGALQHTGENILELTRSIANRDTQNNNQESSREFGLQVYFDVFGLFFVTYSMKTAIVFNYAVVFCAVMVPYYTLSRATKGINKRHLRYEIFLGFLINMISFVFSNAFCYAIAYDLDMTGKSMAWYANTFNCIPTYCLATVFVQCIAHFIFNRSTSTPLSLGLQGQARLIGTCFFWAILTAALTSAGIRTAYAIMVPLLLTLLSNLLIGFSAYHNSVRRWLYVHLIGQVFVVLWTSTFYHLVVDVFIPTAGRSGGNKNPDVMIAIICSSLTFFITSYLTPLVILFKKCKNLLITIFAVYIITRFYIIAWTNFGFPYEDDSSGAPRVQRHYISHTIRTLYDRDGNVRYTDSGFWMLEMDRNARKTIQSLAMPEEAIPQDENILCRNEVFCGLPFIFARQMMTGGFWIPSQPPIIQEVGHLKLVSHDKPTTTLHRLNLTMTGNFLSSLHIRLKDYVTLHSWSLTERIPPEISYKNRSSYFVTITHGLQSGPLNITLDLKTSEGHKRSLVDITLVNLHVEYHKEHTTAFATLLSKMPSWAHVVPSVAMLKSWTF